ncbi:MAG: hypothetical protein R2743_02185 [Ilumatobacteraceae bacterium]
MVLEADPDGGVLGARYGVGVDPGAITLVTALRRSDKTPLDIDDHGRLLDDRVLLIPGPESPDLAHSVWKGEAQPTAVTMALAKQHDWFVDCGRLRIDSVSAGFTQFSSLNIVVVGAATEDLVQLPPIMRRLEETGGPAAVIVVGKPAHSAAEIAQFLGTDHIYVVPAVRNLASETAAVFRARGGRRSWLWRRAVGVAAELHAIASLEHQPVEASTA